MDSTLSDKQKFVGQKDMGQWFRVEASEVLSSLRKRVATVLADLGDFSRPAELQHALCLDKTLGRQIFKLASTAEPLGLGGVVPSRVALGRFLDLAGERGIVAEKLANVWKAFEEFEQLVKTHAGDRVTFNSMVAAASGVDDEWLSTDLQHRRNAFRAMSHTMGLQSKTRLQLCVVNEDTNADAYIFARISGFIGLRMLRAIPSVRVDGISLSMLKSNTSVTVEPTVEPIGLSPALEGLLLESYSTKPLPSLRLKEYTSDGRRTNEVIMDNPKVGITGSATLLFGSIYRNIPRDNSPFVLHITNGRPVEVLLFDVLCKPGLFKGAPVGKAALGYHERLTEEMIPLEGKFDADLMGKGPSALATPEVPRYTDMLDDLSHKLGWNLTEYDAWRVRVEFPLYRSTVTLNWGDTEK